MNEIALGDLVEWAAPQNHAEAKERFEVIEDNGDRLIIRFVCELPIPPTQVVRRDDVKLVTVGDEYSLAAMRIINSRGE